MDNDVIQLPRLKQNGYFKYHMVTRIFCFNKLLKTTTVEEINEQLLIINAKIYVITTAKITINLKYQHL